MTKKKKKHIGLRPCIDGFIQENESQCYTNLCLIIHECKELDFDLVTKTNILKNVIISKFK